MSAGVQLEASVPAEDMREASRALSTRWPVAVGLLLSLLLHVLFGFLMIEFQARDDATPADIVIPVELVELPPPQAPAPPPPPPPPPPAPQVQAPPPPPPPPVPEVRHEPVPMPPPQIVQRETAPNAARSSAPRVVPPRSGAPPAPAAPPAPHVPESRDGLLPPSPPAERKSVAGVAAGRATTNEPAGPAGEKLAQSEVDFILAQVLRVWLIDYRAARFKDIVISGNFQLNPDGTLGAPFGVNDPWSLERMISNYADLLRPDARDQRAALESFLAAMRQAQPFKRQADAPAMNGPKILSFSFRLGDL
jgi:hypothetical protein